MKFEIINFTFILTFNCNLKCSYCIQGGLQKDRELISLKNFKLTIFKLKREIIKTGVKKINITLMGGEISTKPETIEYFHILFKELNELKESNKDLDIEVTFLTNFTGPENYFIDILKNLSNYIKYSLDITLHHEFTNQNNFSKIRNKLDNLILHQKNFSNFKIFFNFLKNNENKKHYIYQEPLEYIKTLSTVSYEISSFYSEYFNKESKNPLIKCNALAYNSYPNGEIEDICRQLRYKNPMSFKIIQQEIICDKDCPCDFFKVIFNQNNIKEIKVK